MISRTSPFTTTLTVVGLPLSHWDDPSLILTLLLSPPTKTQIHCYLRNWKRKRDLLLAKSGHSATNKRRHFSNIRSTKNDNASSPIPHYCNWDSKRQRNRKQRYLVIIMPTKEQYHCELDSWMDPSNSDSVDELISLLIRIVVCEAIALDPGVQSNDALAMILCSIVFLSLTSV